jgi:hypothetical protein
LLIEEENVKKTKLPKQLTLDNLPNAKDRPTQITSMIHVKRIIITEIDTLTNEDELKLKVGFTLIPSKNSFSKVKLDLSFDNQQIKSFSIIIPQSPLAKDEFELTPVLDMKGIPAGQHKIKVEMYELWSSDEKLLQTFKEATVDYIPITLESRFVKIPSVKSVVGVDLTVVSELEKDLYRDIEKTTKKEQFSKRDDR